MLDLYLERENDRITLEEWKAYVNTDEELRLDERGHGINPLTKTPLIIMEPGKAIWNPPGDEDIYEIRYKDGRVGCEGGDKKITGKLIEIAKSLSASVFDCGDKIM